MNRLITQPGAVPLDSDLLNAQRNMMIAHGWLMQMVLGSDTVCTGLACTPTSPPSMAVQIGPGMLTQSSNIDATQFGSLPLGTDNTAPLVKAGILPAYDQTKMLFNLTPPPLAGQVINYLIEAAFLEVDDTPLVLPYFNSANPLQAFQGPAGSGDSVFTNRAQKVQLQLKAGVPAADGTQVTPVVDVGWVPLWVIVVKSGDVSIDSTRILQHPSAPFVSTTLTQLQPLFTARSRKILSGDLNIYVDPAGKDSNDGLTPTTPLGTLQAAWDLVAYHYDLSGHNVTINCVDGTYTSGVICTGMPPGISADRNNNANPANCIAFEGNEVSPSNCLVSVTGANCFTARSGAEIQVRGFKVQATSGVNTAYNGTGAGLRAAANSGIVFGRMDFGVCGSPHIQAVNSSFVASNGDTYNITGSAPSHMSASHSSYLTTTNSIVTLVSALAFSSGFAYCDANSFLYAANQTFLGTKSSATGFNYKADTGGVIQTSGGGVFYFPGNQFGSLTNGGLYL